MPFTPLSKNRGYNYYPELAAYAKRHVDYARTKVYPHLTKEMILAISLDHVLKYQGVIIVRYEPTEGRGGELLFNYRHHYHSRPRFYADYFVTLCFTVKSKQRIYDPTPHVYGRARSEFYKHFSSNLMKHFKTTIPPTVEIFIEKKELHFVFATTEVDMRLKYFVTQIQRGAYPKSES